MKQISQQSGNTLITALVMLVVLTLLVLSGIRASTTNLRIAGNMQYQQEAIAAAQQATEQIISSNFTIAPVASSISVDINNDGTPDYTATFAAPICSGSTPLQNNTPNLPPQCLSSGSSQNTGIIFASAAQLAGTSWCLAQQWDIKTSVTTGATAIMHQGVTLNVPVGTGC